MTLDETQKYFGSYYKIAKNCGFSTATPYGWKKKGFIPLVAQVVIEKFTDGVLKSSWEDSEGYREKHKNDHLWDDIDV
jgi:hypothetical protein